MSFATELRARRTVRQYRRRDGGPLARVRRVGRRGHPPDPGRRGDAWFTAAASARSGDPAVQRGPRPAGAPGSAALPGAAGVRHRPVRPGLAGSTRRGRRTGVAFAVTDARFLVSWSAAAASTTGRRRTLRRSATGLPQVRDGGGTPIRATILLTRWLFELGAARAFMTSRRGERCFCVGGPPGGVRARGNDALTRRLAGPALRRDVVRPPCPG